MGDYFGDRRRSRIYNPDGTTIVDQTWSNLQLRGSGSSRPLDWWEIGNQCNRVVTGVAVDEYRYWDQIAVSSQRIGPIVGAGASGYTPFDVGINFRDTTAYVTDPAGTIHHNGDLYPTQRFVGVNLLAFQGQTVTDFGMSGENLSVAVDARLAGAVYRAHSWGAGQTQYSMDTYAPIGGTYDLRLALGGVGVTCFPNFEFRDGDGGPVLFTISDAAGCAAGEFYDANGVKRTSAADWVANNTPRSITLTSSKLVLLNKWLSPLSSGGSRISHLQLVRTG